MPPAWQDYLITRLRGLCDLRDKPFLDHEMTFIHSLTAGNSVTPPVGGGASQAPLRCRLRRSLSAQAAAYGPGHEGRERQEDAFQLRYLGSAEPDRHVMRRLTMEIPVSSNATLFLRDLGFQVRPHEGWCCRDSNHGLLSVWCGVLRLKRLSYRSCPEGDVFL